MRLLLVAMAVSAVSVAAPIGGPAELNPVRTQPHAQQQSNRQQIVVKLRATGASAAVAATGRTQALSAHDRVANLLARSGLAMRESREITDRLHVVIAEPASQEESIDATLARLRADSEVEYAEADQRRYIHATPNDTLYPEVSSANSGQWYLQNDPATPAAVNAAAAWDVTKGDPNLVIADLDTGVVFEHPDLLAVAAAGRLLPGYDFVSDATVANDGDGRDADASDPGDWVTTADTNTATFKGCTVGNSSWHGTRTAGILGALTNNAQGIAGMTWNGRILPVRVLGKCGGYDSDIIAGLLWAAGISVSGVPDNPNPARVINMSLGGTGDTCPADYSDAIAQVVAKGAVVVVSAGNENGPVDVPANCPGVAGVAGLRHVGTKAGYSSFGPEIAVGAPAGNCVNTGPGQPCLYAITSTVNLGMQSPDPDGNDYTGQYSCSATTGSYAGCTVGPNQYRTPNLGTSFSAPIVSGISALMLAANSHLNSCQLISRLKEGAQPFPQTSMGETPQPPMCPQTDPTSQECICSLDGKTCGAGMANAAGAVAAALRPIAVVTLPVSVSAGQSVSLSAQNSMAATGHTITSYQWTNKGAQSAAITNGTTATPTVTAPSCGYATLQVAVTDDAGREDTADVVLSPTSATTVAPTSTAIGACKPTTPALLLAVCPATSSVVAGSGTQTFTASVANSNDNSVTWEVNSIAGGNSTVGTISSSGVYTAPANVPSPAVVTIEAISAADQTVTSSTDVTITAAPPSGHGGGALDPLMLFAEGLALGAGLISRRYARRCAASSQDFCALR